MTWLTQIPISALKGINMKTDIAAMHRSVMGLFAALPEGNGNRRDELGVLWRKEPTSYILIRSKIAPTNLPISAKTRQEPQFSLHSGDPILFRIAVNAVVRHPKEKGGHTPVEDVESWLAAKLSSSLDDLVAFRHDRTVYKSQVRDLTIQTDLLEGAAIVADPSHLERQLENGVGRAKAFGCGLLTVARR